MKGYYHHIRDFNNAARHLNRIEKSIYRDMIELYYDTEKPLPLDIDMLCHKVSARSEEERTAVQQVLKEFFICTELGHFHEVCDEIILDYWAYKGKKSAGGKASAAKRAARKEQVLNSRSTPVEHIVNKKQLNQKPETINHKPETIITTKLSVTDSLDIYFNNDFYLEAIKKYRPDLMPVLDQVVAMFRLFFTDIGSPRTDWPEQWVKWILKERIN